MTTTARDKDELDACVCHDQITSFISDLTSSLFSNSADALVFDSFCLLQRLLQGKAFAKEDLPSIYAPSAIADPVQWWVDYGDDMPQLQAAAKRVLTVVPTASGGERNWSTFAHVWNKKRSRLLLRHVYKLVYIYFNQRVLKRTTSQPTAADFEAFMEYLEGLSEEDLPVPQAAIEIDEDEP